jgi:hypothetical protein
LLPFSKNNASEIVELDEADFILEDDRPKANLPKAELPKPRPKLHTPRVALDEAIEDDVVGECLAQIAAESARVPLVTFGGLAPPESPESSSGRSALRAPLPSITPISVTPVPVPLPEDPPTTRRSGRLPTITSPPFVRTSSGQLAAPPSSGTAMRVSERELEFEVSDEEIEQRESKPGIFSRTKATQESTPLTVVTEVRTASSVAPVSLPAHTNEPTVILLRERPRMTWIVGAAAVGALVALVATRLFSSADAAMTTAVPAPPPPPGTVVVAPLAPTTPATVLRFDDNDGIAIPAVPAPAPQPVVTAAAVSSPKAPVPPKPVVAAAPPPPAPKTTTTNTTARPLTPDPPAKKPLTPEQQLAEAQLKASMK